VEKSCCLAIGRLHPGETQGSWMMDGFMKFLNSPESFYLREKFIFIIVPMINVDGVVLGNFRTGIAGRDLNRVFDTPQNYK
jgi:murein tripeptide amidase MpaA